MHSKHLLRVESFPSRTTGQAQSVRAPKILSQAIPAGGDASKASVPANIPADPSQRSSKGKKKAKRKAADIEEVAPASPLPINPVSFLLTQQTCMTYVRAGCG